MEIFPADNTGIAHALEILRRGGVVAHATETCYGLACDMANPDAVAKLFAIKRRPVTQPVSALFLNTEEAKHYVQWNGEAEAMADMHLPGPLTLILPLRADAPATVYPIPAGSATVGVRVSPHPVALALAKGFGAPISTTSANIHGQPNPYSVGDITAQFADAKDPMPDLVLDSGQLPQVPPSTVVNLANPDSGVVRKGTIGLW